MRKEHTKHYIYENSKETRKHALRQWKEVYDKTNINNVDKEEIIRTMRLLNTIDGEILADPTLTAEEKTKLFKKTTI